MDLSNISRVCFPTSYIVFDLETSGFSLEGDRILEFAYVVYEGGKKTQEYSTLLNHGITIPEEATAVNHITHEMCALEGKDPLMEITKLVGKLKSGLPVVTHNGIAFDEPFLKAEMKRLGVTESLVFSHIDTAVMVKAMKLDMLRRYNESYNDFGARVMKVYAKGVKYNLPLCCSELGVDAAGITAHRAMADCILTNEVYRKLTSPQV